MNDAKHTPGEWIVEGEDQFAKVVSMAGWTIAESSHIHVADLDDAESMHVANMRLIAAAPDLLAALIGCVEHMEHSTPQGRAAWTTAHTAIAKAKGGAA